MIFGLKNVRHELRFMANDEVDIPTGLVGKKIAPILEMKSIGLTMPESMDIVKRIDEDESFGAPILRPASGRKDLSAWQEKHSETFRLLQRPRYVATGILPEFAFSSARDAYVKNHPVGDFTKADWKDDSKCSPEFRWGEYRKAMQRTAELLPVANDAIKELDQLIFAPEHCTEGGLSYDDIDLFGRLRSVTIIKDLVLTEKVAAYLDYMSRKCDIPLYDPVAI